MHGRVWPSAVALLAVEVLDEGGEGIEVAARRIPADKDFAGIGPQMKSEHLLLVVHVDFDLLGSLGMRYSIAVADFDFCPVFTARSEESSDNAFLVGWSAQRMIEY